MIDEAILKKEHEERQSDLEALKLTMTRYVNADIVNPEKCNFMDIMISEASHIRTPLVRSSNRVSMFPMVASVSVLHMNILRERAFHGTAVCHLKDNSTAWTTEVKETAAEY